MNRAQALIDDLLENLDDEEGKIEKNAEAETSEESEESFFPKDAKTVKSDDEDEESDKDKEPDPYEKIDLSVALIAPEATPDWDAPVAKKEPEAEEKSEPEEGEDEEEEEGKKEEAKPEAPAAPEETDPRRKLVKKHADAVSTILGKVSESMAKHKAVQTAERDTERKIMDRYMTKKQEPATGVLTESTQPAWRRYLKP